MKLSTLGISLLLLLALAAAARLATNPAQTASNTPALIQSAH